MKFTTRPSFELTGLHIHTTWLNNQAKSDIAKLWKRFYKDDIASQLDFSVDDAIYLLYTDYQQSSNQGFSVWLGLETEADAPLPMDMRRFKIPTLNYFQFDAASEMQAAQAYELQQAAQAGMPIACSSARSLGTT